MGLSYIDKNKCSKIYHIFNASYFDAVYLHVFVYTEICLNYAHMKIKMIKLYK